MEYKLINILNLYKNKEIENFKITTDSENNSATVELYFTINIEGFDGYEELFNCELDKFTVEEFKKYKEKKRLIFKNWCLGEVM